MRADHLYVIPACPRCFGQAEKTGRRKRWTCVACGQQWSKIAAGIVLAPFAIALSPVIAAMWLVTWAYKQIGVDAWE